MVQHANGSWRWSLHHDLIERWFAGGSEGKQSDEGDVTGALLRRGAGKASSKH
jgi:hypothetical protein